MGQSVFISHASEDRATADLVRSVLEVGDNAVSCWIAPRDIPAGMRYAEALLEGIERCTVLLLLYSKHAEASPHVMNEVEHAASHSKRILVVRLDEADPRANRSVSIFLNSHQWLDASAGGVLSHLVQISESVRALLVPAPAAPTPPPAPAPHPGAAQSVGTRPGFAPSLARAVGVEVAPGRILITDVDLDNPGLGSLKGEFVVQTTDVTTIRGVLDRLRLSVNEFIADRFPKQNPPVGIGIALPGQVDPKVGSLKFGPNLFAARNVPFKSSLMASFPNIPVRVDNDVRCATRAEARVGVGQSFDSFVSIYVGEGVGSGVVLDRRIYFGSNFCAGEIGHVKISPTGHPCSCGQIGCLETFINAKAIVARASAKAVEWTSRDRETSLRRAAEEGPLTLRAVLDAVESGDEAARDVVGEIGLQLGTGIANYVNIVNPAAVVLVGELMDELFLTIIGQITDGLRNNTLPEVVNTPIVQSSLGRGAPAIGAALMFHAEEAWRF